MHQTVVIIPVVFQMPALPAVISLLCVECIVVITLLFLYIVQLTNPEACSIKEIAITTLVFVLL